MEDFARCDTEGNEATHRIALSSQKSKNPFISRGFCKTIGKNETRIGAILDPLGQLKTDRVALKIALNVLPLFTKPIPPKQP
jgi:hypothetical protein